MGAIPSLIGLLRDADTAVRRNAARALGCFAEPINAEYATVVAEAGAGGSVSVENRIVDAKSDAETAGDGTMERVRSAGVASSAQLDWKVRKIKGQDKALESVSVHVDNV